MSSPIDVEETTKNKIKQAITLKKKWHTITIIKGDGYTKPFLWKIKNMINSANIIAKQNNSYVINDPNEWFQLLGWGNNEKWYTITINNGDGDMRPFLWEKTNMVYV